MISRKAILITTLITLILVFYLARDVMMPFVFALIFAYIFNPFVDRVQKKFKFHRVWGIFLLYILLSGFIVYFSIWTFNKILAESTQFTREIGSINSFGIATFQKLPEWVIGGKSFGVKTLVSNGLQSIVSTINEVEDSLIPIFTEILGYTLKFLVFLVASFYLLKDGNLILEKLINKFPKKNVKEIKEVAHRINIVLGGYLRGQLLLIIIMGTASSVFLTILGVKYAIILGIVTGFLELIPFVGPIVATAAVAGIAFITGENNFAFDSTTISIIIIVVYFTLRQLEDYFIIPQLLGRLTKIHPLLVLFSIITGGAIAGPVGFILGVPVVASARVLLEYYWEKNIK